MLDKLLPRSVDNTYRGHWAALWLLGLVAGVMALQGVLVIFSGRWILKDADGIPIDTYPAAAAQTIEALWANRGLSRFIIASLCALALVRYRSAVPFMFLLLALNYLAGELVLFFIPLVRTGTPAGPTANLVLFALTVVGLVLSILRRGRS